MEINDLFGLPAHPLLVHIPVVLIPLATIGSLFVAIKPEWRRRYAIPVAALAAVGAVAVFLAAQSGESLEERVKENDLVEEHAEAGESAEPFVAVYGVLAVGLAAADLVDRRRRGGGAGDPAPAADQGGVATATATQDDHHLGADPGPPHPGRGDRAVRCRRHLLRLRGRPFRRQGHLG